MQSQRVLRLTHSFAHSLLSAEEPASLGGAGGGINAAVESVIQVTGQRLRCLYHYQTFVLFVFVLNRMSRIGSFWYDAFFVVFYIALFDSFQREE